MVHELVANAVRLSRLFKGVAHAAGRLVMAQRRAAERVYTPGSAGYHHAMHEYSATLPELESGGSCG